MMWVERGRARSGLTLAAALLAGVWLAGAPARAQEILPREFVPAPAGTNINLGYYIHGSSDNFITTTGHSVPGTHLDTNVGLERFVHYGTVGGMPAGFQIIEAFGGLSGKLGGQSLGNAFGAGNTALSAFIWPIADQAAGRYLVVTGFVYPPTGTYNKNDALNLTGALSGWPGWTGDVQIGWDQAFGEHFSYDVSIDGRFYTDTTGPIQAGVPISVRQHKAPDARAQLWLNYAFNKAFTTSIGYEGFFGGQDYFDNPAVLGGRGHTNVSQSREHRIRAAASLFLSPRFQTVVELDHDVDRKGGFKQDFGAQVRILYIF